MARPKPDPPKNRGEPVFYNRPFGLHQFIIEGEIDEPKSYAYAESGAATDVVRALLNKVMLCLRTFKPGAVGYDWIHYKPLKCVPIAGISHIQGDLQIPIGSYHLSAEEIPKIQNHAKLILSSHDLSIEMALSRLADAEIRVRPEDRLVDAVIGMEALLLAAIEPGGRQTELSFRFSLNYAMLAETPEERAAAFKVAKDLYNLRSLIAHGGSGRNGLHRVGQEKLMLPEVAQRATAALRSIILHFLPNAEEARHKNHEFWQRAYFGFPPP